MNLPGEQINPSQQAERTMPFVLMIARESRVDAGLGRQIGRGRCNGLDSWFFVVGDDGYRLARLRFGSLFQHLDLAINAQDLRHLLLELGVAAFQIIPYLVRLDFLLAEYLAHRSLHHFGETFVPGDRRVLARMACLQTRRPQFVRITMILGLVASQRYQPRFCLGCNRRLLTRSRPIIKRRQWAIGQGPLHTALNRLMMQTESLPDSEERGFLTVRKQYLRSPEVREKMFNPFFTTKPAGEGTGLGLSISHDIVVKQHAGSIEVDSKPGEFTEIRIVLPRTGAFPVQSGG